jgi:hypothetical protein
MQCFRGSSAHGLMGEENTDFDVITEGRRN